MIPISIQDEIRDLATAVDIAPDSKDPKARLKVFLRARELYAGAVQWMIASSKFDDDMLKAVRSAFTQSLEVIIDENYRRQVEQYLEEFRDTRKLAEKYPYMPTTA